MPGSGMSSDVTRGEGPRLIPSKGGRWLAFTAPLDGAYELWRIARRRRPARTAHQGRHYISGWDGVPHGSGSHAARADRLSALDADGAAGPVAARTGQGGIVTIEAAPADQLQRRGRSARLELREPVERHVTVDGRDIQGWLIPAGDGPQPLVVQIHGGPHTLYGWSPRWEFQILAAAGISVFYCNPRGSEGYGEAFNDANHRDWGAGPMRDVLAGVDALVADGLADPERLGVTGGSYGGYLTNWIVGHDQRFRAAMTCRSVNDMGILFTTGDIAGGDWAASNSTSTPWEDPAYFREISPIAYADQIRTPLLIQHSERDLRTTIAPGRGAVHRPPLAPPACPSAARARGDPRTDPLRDAVPAGREPAGRRSLVPPLPGRRQGRHAATPQGPRRPLNGLAFDTRFVTNARVRRICQDQSFHHGPTPRPGHGRPDVSSPSHDRHATFRQPDPRARERADPCVGRPARTARQPARPGDRGRPGRGRGAGRIRSGSARSRRPRRCGRSSSRSR